MSNPYKGVTASKGHRHDGKWQVQVRIGAKIVTWGVRFDDPQDAARLADAIFIYLKGPDAQLNFDGRPPVGVTWDEVREFLDSKGAALDGPWVENPQQYCKTPLI